MVISNDHDHEHAENDAIPASKQIVELSIYC